LIDRESKTNGEVGQYTFELKTTVPMVNGDILKFSFPEQIGVNADGVTQCNMIVGE
jgi:hypothetical protein